MQKINSSTYKTIKILISPLDWGLGHATRCFPIIKELIKQKCEVWIAAADAQKILLQEEFPNLSIVELPGYGVKYGKNRALTILRLIFTFPKILIRIKQENRWLRQFIALHQPDAIISDNRYGLHAPGLFSIFITHQLRIRSPFGRWTDDWLQKIHYRAIRKFSRCWIPDVEGPLSLAGALSHPDRLPDIPTRYIGWLSRFERDEGDGDDLLVLLSGPEPQRTLLEDKVLAQVEDWKRQAGLGESGVGSGKGRVILVRGLPGTQKGSAGRPLKKKIPEGLLVYNHLPVKKLERVIRSAGLVIARSGYSTVMDLARLGKKAVFIPTPGQTEQEYLGNYLSRQGWALCIKQEMFSLPAALTAAAAFPFRKVEQREGDRLKKEITEALRLLRRS
jgi:UDP-N-acetylglucosamine transferase subunit ALG13